MCSYILKLTSIQVINLILEKRNIIFTGPFVNILKLQRENTMMISEMKLANVLSLIGLRRGAREQCIFAKTQDPVALFSLTRLSPVNTT